MMQLLRTEERKLDTLICSDSTSKEVIILENDQEQFNLVTTCTNLQKVPKLMDACGYVW